MTMTRSPPAVMTLASHHHHRSHSMPLTMNEEDHIPGKSRFILASRSTTQSNNTTPYARPTSSSKRSISPSEDTEAGYIFGATRMHERLYTGDGNECGVEIQCKMDRGFFLADDKWTCYRRNYFQLTGTFIVTRGGPYYVKKQQRIRNFYFQLSARQLEADLQVKLIQLTPKRDKGPQNDPPLLAIQPIILSPSFGTPPIVSGESAMATAATFERIQFKSATANNGKKRASQQFFVLALELLVELDNGERFTVASAQSLPLVVRGRSPGHYADSGRRKKLLSPSSSTSSMTTTTTTHVSSTTAIPPPTPLPSLSSSTASSQQVHPSSVAPPRQQRHPHEWHPLPSTSTSAGYYPPPITPQQYQQQAVPVATAVPPPQLDFSYFAPHGRSQSANVPLIMNQHARWDFSPSSSSSGQTTLPEENNHNNNSNNNSNNNNNNNNNMYDTKFFHCYTSYSAALSDD
ncbi:hypothetical protein BDA99DRAFT_340380 [Phascolomyces articulosus]|uniref:NDT80 domain-containing protein n=1 Tax=Phascolomyces articulosus TaxID=60185 RepID=A0AAD5K4K5_9FUNG|nr:hypothetical protein BDA99DRAFT_340380 [Phascolomyces articulosus]